MYVYVYVYIVNGCKWDMMCKYSLYERLWTSISISIGLDICDLLYWTLFQCQLWGRKTPRIVVDALSSAHQSRDFQWTKSTGHHWHGRRVGGLRAKSSFRLQEINERPFSDRIIISVESIVCICKYLNGRRDIYHTPKCDGTKMSKLSKPPWSE